MTDGNAERFVSDQLEIEVKEDSESIDVIWTGKSIDRDPGKFITPILTGVLNRSVDRQKEVVLDFRKLRYMNSSTITPVIKILERAKRGNVRVRVFYDSNRKWQDLSFSALAIFQTRDGRVTVRGL